jgi:hypothetical protein
MKTKKENELKKRQLWRYNAPLTFLVISIVLAVTIVACNKDFLATPEYAAVDLEAKADPFSTTDEVGDIAGFVFEQIGTGLLRKIGDAGMGWALGAIGLSAEGNTTAETKVELGKINDKLTTINNSLTSISNELQTLETEIGTLGCSNAISNLEDNISWISVLQDDYSNFIAVAKNDSLAIPSDTLQRFVNHVLNGETNGGKMMHLILNDFKIHLYGSLDASILDRCLDITKQPLPEYGFGTDTEYYNKVSKISNYYYGWYTAALLLFNEANNYNSWKIASNSSLDTTLTTVSIAKICDITDNVGIQLNCGINIKLDTTAYNVLKTMFTMVGAPYTNSNQILNNTIYGGALWARSLEKYNQGLGFDQCDDPLIYKDPVHNAPCGVVQNFYFSNLGFTPNFLNTFEHKSGWQFASMDELQSLFPEANSASSFLTVGHYLESLGFEKLVNTGKVVQAHRGYGEPYTIHLSNSGTSLIIGPDNQYRMQEFDVIPFFYVDMYAYHGLIINDAQFSNIFPYSRYGAEHYCEAYEYDNWCYYNHWEHKSALTSGNDYASSSTGYFRGHAMNELNETGGERGVWTQFTWTDSNWIPGNGTTILTPGPGWLSQNNTSAFMWPVNIIANTTCDAIPGRTKTNYVGALSMCGDDFTFWLDNILPPLPSSVRK